jgi:hypothetical protein
MALCLSLLVTDLSAKSDQKRLPYKPTPDELMNLPDYCQARIAGDAEAKRQWTQIMGKDIFAHLHHYCNGLNYSRRAELAFGSIHKPHYLQMALGEFNYVLRNWPPDFELAVDAQRRKQLLEFQINKR